MHCSKTVQQLQLYIDKQLTLDQIRAIENHLSICPACHSELFLLEEIDYALREITLVTEPADLATNIMRRVAFSVQQKEEASYVLLRPSLTELLTVILLATITTLGVILEQPSLRETLPFTGGHSLLTLVFLNTSHVLTTMSSETLMWVIWVVGTVLGVWITLALAGTEMRTTWFKAVMDRLPVR